MGIRALTHGGLTRGASPEDRDASLESGVPTGLGQPHEPETHSAADMESTDAENEDDHQTTLGSTESEPAPASGTFDATRSWSEDQTEPIGPPPPADGNLGDGQSTSQQSPTRYRIIRPHAEGGLGAVFVAHDEELHREVALKEILERHAHLTENRLRFLLEAEVTGGLEHPGIVPVHGLGQYEDGRPYYAMRFIRGISLKAAIASYHAAEDRSAIRPSVLYRFAGSCGTSSTSARRLPTPTAGVCFIAT